MSKTTNLLLVIALFAAVAVQSVYSAAADTVTLTNSSFYKEKGYGKLVSSGDASLASTVGLRGLVAGKNSKTNYYVYQTNTATDKDNANKGGTTTIVFKKIDVSKLAFNDDAAVTVSGFKWGGTSSQLSVGATVKNNVTLVGRLWADPAIDNPLKHIYVYLVDLDKNEKTELLLASASYTDATNFVTQSIEFVWYSKSLTGIVYTTSARTSATAVKNTHYVVTVKDGKIGTPTTIKEVSYTIGGDPYDELVEGGISATGENLVVVFQKETDNLKTETVYPFTVTEKETKTGTTAVLNTQVAETNTYSFQNILAHVEGRWVAVYANQTESGSTTTSNLVAKASNDTTGFKVLQSYTEVDKASRSASADTYFAGLVLWIRDGSTSSGENSIDQYTYSYQTYGGDLVALGTKTAYLSTSGKYASQTQPQPQRVGDNKAVNLLVTQIKVDPEADPTTTYEAVYFGQIFQKSFGATLQSVLAVCSLMLAALFVF